MPGNLTVIRIKKVVFVVYFISLLTIRVGDVRLGCPVNQCKFQALVLRAGRQLLCIACVESFTGQFDFVFCVLIRGL